MPRPSIAARRSASIVRCGKRGEALGERQRPLEVGAGGDDLGEQADRERLLRIDDASGEDQVECPAETDDARQPLRAAVDQRHAPAPLGIAEPRALGRDAQVAPQRELEPAGQAKPEIAAIVGLDGVSRVKPIGPSSLVRRSTNVRCRLQVGAGAERRRRRRR